MKFASILAFSAALAAAAPGLALAADCNRPAPPAKIDGASATLDQVMADKSAVTQFMTASDAYQDCLIADLKAQQAAARAAKTKLDPAIAKATDAKTSENQADKEHVGADFNATVKAYRAAHPS